MKIIIKAEFNTDGDYRIEGYDFSKPKVAEDIDINLSDRKFKIFTEEYSMHPFDDEYSFGKSFECEDISYCQMYARSYLEELLCSIKYLSTHYYIMPYFYEMFDNAIKSIGHENHYYGNVSGNYDGTELEIWVTDN